MKSLYISILILALATLACGLQTLPLADSASPTPVPKPRLCVTVTAYMVNLRDENGVRTGQALERGYVVCGKVEEDYFVINGGMRVWLGCVSVDSEYGCQAE